MSISAQTRTALFLVGAGVLLFGSAGTFLIPAFWLYLAVLTAVFIVSFVMLDPELLHERIRPGGNPLPFGVMLATLVFSLHWVVAGLDRGRFHLSDTVPLPLQAVGFFVFAAGQVLAFWAMRVNRFFSSIVRIQSDRGQYALGSWFAVAFVLAANVPFILRRLIVEDRVLRAQLAGYEDSQRVRWRLLPGIW